MSDLNIYKQPRSEKRTECAVCRTPLPGPLISLPSLPLTDILVREKRAALVGYVDQAFHLCKVCGHGQLSTLVDPQVLYGEAYAMRTSGSSGARGANDAFLSFIQSQVGKTHLKTIVEVGSNDLYLLYRLQDLADKLIGIDPTLKHLARRNNEVNGKISVIPEMVENADIPNLHNALVITSHFLEHLRDPRAFLEKLLEKADDSTLFIFQFPTLNILLSDLRFDQIYHHHLHYFSLQSFSYLLNIVGGQIVMSSLDPHYWGALRVTFRKSKRGENDQTYKIMPARLSRSYDLFRERMEACGEYLVNLGARGERLIAYGASLQLAVLAYHLGNALQNFECIVDDDPGKRGMYYLNLEVSIVEMKDISHWEEVDVLVTAIGFSRQILKTLIDGPHQLNPRRIIVPLDI